MKRFLLLTGLFAGCAVSAQQNDSLDIEKHLERKSKERSILQLQKTFPFQRESKKPPVLFPEIRDTAFLSHVLANGTRVYLLPNDNMPCLAPNMNQFNMPVKSVAPFTGTIPNAWRWHYNIIPK